MLFLMELSRVREGCGLEYGLGARPLCFTLCNLGGVWTCRTDLADRIDLDFGMPMKALKC